MTTGPGLGRPDTGNPAQHHPTGSHLPTEATPEEAATATPAGASVPPSTSVSPSPPTPSAVRPSFTGAPAADSAVSATTFGGSAETGPFATAGPVTPRPAGNGPRTTDPSPAAGTPPQKTVTETAAAGSPPSGTTTGAAGGPGEAKPLGRAPSGHASWGNAASGTAETGYVPTTGGPRRGRAGSRASVQGESELVREAIQNAAVSRETTSRSPAAQTPRISLRAMSGRGDERWPKPPRCRILTIANQKGGVGKTTTSVNLAASLAMHGLQVLVVDLDPQGNASTALGVDHHADIPSVYEVLIEDRPLADIVVAAPEIPNLYCAPATLNLAGAEIELVSKVARESRLRRALEAYDTDRFDYVLIDCPPSLGLLTVNALVGAEEVLIPIQCEYYALEGLGQLLRTVDLVNSHLNPRLEVSTILLTMYDARTRLAAQVAEEVRGHFGDVVLKTVIPRSVRVSEAPSYGQSVMTYDPGSSGALAYSDAAFEIAHRGAEETR